MPDTMEGPNQKEKTAREKALEEISGAIEKARKAGLIENEAANLATVALGLTGNEALLANRLVARGSDPASLELISTGEISEPVMRAHRMGPGALKTAKEKENWLTLAAASIDEHAAADLSVLEKAQQFHKSLVWLAKASKKEKKAAAEEELQKILSLPFETGEISGVKMRIYTSDRGFAAAYWSGEPCAAVKEGGLTFVGSQEKPFTELGIKVDKQLSPTFGIIFDK